MKIDIFEDMKDCIGCNDVSDLPYRKREVWEEIKRQIPLQYPKEQLEKFSHYVFGVDYAVIMGILCIFRKNCASVPEERSAIPLQTEQSSAG